MRRHARHAHIKKANSFPIKTRSPSLFFPFLLLFRADFLALPWLWGLNAWLWHGSGDPVVRQCEWERHVRAGWWRLSLSPGAPPPSTSSTRAPPLLFPLADAKRSAVGAALAAAVAVPWAAAFTLGGPRLVGQALYDRLNVAGWDLAAYGLQF